MSEKMMPLSIKELLSRLKKEYESRKTVFGISEMYKPKAENKGKSLSVFGEKLEVPLGPAAGPHTQMAQNIISAYVGGARFFELKTVQIMDGEDLAKCIARPCIKADDEGYNCEWSTELTVQQAFEEYVKAWCVLKVISKAYDLGSPDGFVFNMSVGYDLDGIKSEKIDSFIEGLKDASGSPIFAETKAALKEFFPDYSELVDGISPNICRSVTLSTLHGCPPDEIERIATYLLTEKGLNTFVKCNPTILGYESARAILDFAGFDYVAFDDHHFKEDLQYGDAVEMFKRLMTLAEDKGLEFGVKLSNTFPVDVKQNELPSEEMYMSGRSLFHLTIEMARRFSLEFNGKLRISYSGGATQETVKELFEAGVYPITVATTLLKTGGYSRLVPMAHILADCEYKPFDGTDTKKIEALSNRIKADESYLKPIKPIPSRKNGEDVPLFDCFIAPCSGGCPIHQDIPEYIKLVNNGKYKEALKVVTEKNPLPFTTGTICSHRCMSRCTHHFYDYKPVDIRAAKLTAAENGYAELISQMQTPKKNGIKVAVVGAGAAGLSAAYFLSRGGAEVDVYEKADRVGGIVSNVIPDFRIKAEAVENDAELVRKMGANILLSAPAPSLEKLKESGYTAVVCGIGAYKARNPHIDGKVLNVIDFLKSYKEGKAELGKNVVVVGGGNTAMDAARAAARADGVEKVSIVYRRTKKYMPADEEELKEAIADGVQLIELAAPVKQENGELLCSKMKLGEPDESGRRSPVVTDEKFSIPADTVIAAIGELVDTELFASYGVCVDEKGRVPFMTETDGLKLYNIGDSLHDPCTVVECIADAQRAADSILGCAYCADIPVEAYSAPDEAIENKKLYDEKSGRPAPVKCLSCSTVCESCVSVCPNRANAVVILPDGRREILHIDRLCNECGNCKSFCPYSSAPYLDKLTLFEDEESFSVSSQKGFLPIDGHKVKLRLDNITEIDLDGKNELSKDMELFILSVLDNAEMYK